MSLLTLVLPDPQNSNDPNKVEQLHLKEWRACQVTARALSSEGEMDSESLRQRKNWSPKPCHNHRTREWKDITGWWGQLEKHLLGGLQQCSISSKTVIDLSPSQRCSWIHLEADLYMGRQFYGWKLRHLMTVGASRSRWQLNVLRISVLDLTILHLIGSTIHANPVTV